MSRNASSAGFTLLEMLVASLLLGMLITILTMVFNSSSVAWRIGKADVSQMGEARYKLSAVQQAAESALPRIHPTDKTKVGRVLSPWGDKGVVRARAVETLKLPAGVQLEFPTWNTKNSADSSIAQPWIVPPNISKPRSGSATAFTVGVLSYGPDGKPDTADDINTWPDELDE